MGRNHSKPILERIAILLLIFSIAGLSATAKQSKYLPKSNPAHFLGKATKMGVPHHPVPFIPAPLCLVAKVTPRQAESQTAFILDFEKPRLPEIAVMVSLQHRSPPSFLA
jgi:hypothetical protein